MIYHCSVFDQFKTACSTVCDKFALPCKHNWSCHRSYLRMIADKIITICGYKEGVTWACTSLGWHPLWRILNPPLVTAYRLIRLVPLALQLIKFFVNNKLIVFLLACQLCIICENLEFHEENSLDFHYFSTQKEYLGWQFILFQFPGRMAVDWIARSEWEQHVRLVERKSLTCRW